MRFPQKDHPLRPIVTITLNPALDLAISVERVVAGPKLRSDTPRTDPGGGGINVARVVEELTGEATAFVALGGATGKALEQALRPKVTRVEVLALEGDTRQSVAVTDRGSKEQYRFVMPGPQWTAPTIDRALSAIRDLCSEGTLVVLSGSLPPGVPADFPTRLQHVLQNRDVIYDMSGAALAQFAQTKNNAFVLRMDQAEGNELNAAPLPTPEDTAAFAAGLVAQGVAQTVIVARGAEGSVMADAEGRWMVSAAKVGVVSTTGAGDSFVGGLAFALAQGQSMQQAIALGAAAASAAVTTSATELCRKDMVDEVLPQCRVRRIAD